MSTNAEAATDVDAAEGDRLATPVVHANNDRNAALRRPSLTEALTLRRNLLQSLWTGVRQLPRGRRIVLMTRLAVSFAQILAFIPILALPGSHRTSPSHENGRVCNPNSLFDYLGVHVVRLALDIPVELYLGLSPHRTRQGRRAGPEARAVAERDRPLGSEYLDRKVGKLSTMLGIASVVIFFVGNAIVYSSTECSRKPAEAVPLFWAALASLIVVYIFILEIAVLAFLIVCALPLLIAILRALGLTHRLPQRELHPETGKIGQDEVDKRVKLVYYIAAKEDEDVQADQGAVAASSASGEVDATKVDEGAVEERQIHAGDDTISTVPSNRPGLGSRRTTQDSIQSASHPALGRFSRLTRLLVPRQRSTTLTANGKSPGKPPAKGGSFASNPKTTSDDAAPKRTKQGQLKYPLHPLPAHRATCPICLCDFEEPEPDQEPEPEPLRLLECGHVMHRSCVDQWLTTVSGRCPVCQKAVIPELETRAQGATAADTNVHQDGLAADAENAARAEGSTEGRADSGDRAVERTPTVQTSNAEAEVRSSVAAPSGHGDPHRTVTVLEATASSSTAPTARRLDPTAEDAHSESHELQPVSAFNVHSAHDR